MSEWRPKRFWQDVSVAPCHHDGLAIMLDGRAARTPNGARLVVPTRQLADLIADEWRSQSALIDPRLMPKTRLASEAIDTTPVLRREVIAGLVDYADSDLLCHRAYEPADLVDRQRVAWDPILDWCEIMFGIRPQCRDGVMPIRQQRAIAMTLRTHLEAFGDHHLAALRQLVTLTGSLLLGLAAIHRVDSANGLWCRSRVDETWQRERWGHDQEMDKVEREQRELFLDAAEFAMALDGQQADKVRA